MTDSEVQVGEVFWAYTDQSVVAIRPGVTVQKGCVLRLEGLGLQEATSIEVNHSKKEKVPAGVSFGLLVHNGDFTAAAVRKKLESLKHKSGHARIPVFLHLPAPGVPSDSVLAEEPAPA